MLKRDDSERIYETSRTAQIDDVVRALAHGSIDAEEAMRRVRNHLTTSRRPTTLRDRFFAFISLVQWQNEREPTIDER
jgi:hypothetical protein